VLTLVGDFDPGQALAKVKQYFAAIPAQTPPPKVDLGEDPHYGERREVIFDSLARLPRVQMAYLIPQGNTPDNYALSVLGDILSQGQSSRMYQHLVRDKQLASQINVRPDARIGPSLFYITANARPGVKAEDLEKAIDDELADVAKNGVTADELAKAKTQFLRRFIEQRRSTLATANAIGRDAVYFNDPNLINTVIEKEDAVTLDQVNAAAKKYLVRDQRTVVTSLPAAPDQRAAAAGGR
jgi:zinc protease